VRQPVDSERAAAFVQLGSLRLTEQRVELRDRVVVFHAEVRARER
jgi:hypothetical protein